MNFYYTKRPATTELTKSRELDFEDTEVFKPEAQGAIQVEEVDQVTKTTPADVKGFKWLRLQLILAQDW